MYVFAAAAPPSASTTHKHCVPRNIVANTTQFGGRETNVNAITYTIFSANETQLGGPRIRWLQGLGSRVASVRLSSLWYVFLLAIPVTEARPPSSALSGLSGLSGKEKHRSSWMLFCRQTVVECNAVTALWVLWDETAASLSTEVI